MATFKTVDDLINHIMDDKNYANLRFQATENVAKEAVKDIHEGAVSILESHYYARKPRKRFKTKKNGGKYKNGSKKKWVKGYRRTKSLKHSFISTYNVSRTGNGVLCEISVEYSPSALMRYIDSNGIDEYTPSKNVLGAKRDVLEEWVINNFLEGKHPYTDGSTEPGTPVQYYQDPEERTQWAGMRRMFREYVGTILPESILLEMISLQRR